MSGVRHRFVSAALLVVAAVSTAPAVAGKADNSIHFASEQVPPNVDPYFSNLALGSYIGDNVWDSLSYRNPVRGAYEPSGVGRKR